MVLGYEQRGRIRNLVIRDGHGVKNGGKVVEMFSDSRLVVGQVKGEMEAKDVGMQEYLSQIKRLGLKPMGKLATSKKKTKY